MRVHGLVLLYVHRNHQAYKDGEPKTATSTFTQLNSDFFPVHAIRPGVTAKADMALNLFPFLFLQLKELSHDNLNTFVGAHVEPGNSYVLFKYCAKGSLQVKH